MKTIIVASVVALMAMSSTAAYAGGLGGLLNVGVKTGNINVLNGVAVGNNNNILSGIGNITGSLNGNDVLNGVLNGNNVNVLSILGGKKKGH